MAIFVYPKDITKTQLLQEIYDKIDSTSGTPTWERRGLQIVHVNENSQWDEGGYLIQEETTRPYLYFKFKITTGTSPRNGTYGVYNGRFVQFLLNHFTKIIDRFEVVDQRPR